MVRRSLKLLLNFNLSNSFRISGFGFRRLAWPCATLAVACAVVIASPAARAERSLLRVDQQPVEAELISGDQDGLFQFRTAEKVFSVQRRDLVRWSTPRQNLDAQELILVDGSRLILAEAWSGKSSVRIEGDTVFATTKLLGDLSFARSKLHAVLLHGPATSRQRTQMVDRIATFQGEDDRLLLDNGDVMTGQLLEMRSKDSADGLAVTFALAKQSRPISFPSGRVAAVVCRVPQRVATGAALAVGLRDGSQLKARWLIADTNSLQLELASGIQVRGADCRDVVYLQALASRVAYLSDLDPADYRHKPYLDIPWPYKRDRNVLGGLLSAGGKTYAKGLAMHTSSTLIFDLPQQNPGVATPGPPNRYQRFAAQLAVDDAAAGLGSVVFQVVLMKENTARLAFTSPVLRGGDAPRSISVDLGDAERLALVADYADRGDECDYANWLDARLE